VALERALIVGPDILLLDEPLTALDVGIKEKIEVELKKLHQALKTTTVMVTHDFREAYYLANRVGIIKNGKLIKTGLIEEVFQKPGSLFVAEFVGIKNLFQKEKLQGKEGFFVGQLLPDGDYLGVRPEHIVISNVEPLTEHVFKGVISQTKNYYGVFLELDIACQGVFVKSFLTPNRYWELDLYDGKNIFIGFSSKQVCVVSEQ